MLRLQCSLAWCMVWTGPNRFPCLEPAPHGDHVFVALVLVVGRNCHLVARLKLQRLIGLLQKTRTDFRALHMHSQQSVDAIRVQYHVFSARASPRRVGRQRETVGCEDERVRSQGAQCHDMHGTHKLRPATAHLCVQHDGAHDAGVLHGLAQRVQRLLHAADIYVE